ncbi:ankyrin repeat and MYND domain-containing protein 2 [Galendromus occidentalis]|uniref:Ankyrin repeat and MYND domain-containing protein 2 n=1 Tax=Galendromus occidentalis TaxID=34638 RepID=A0AAJ7L6U5_9ACAR|nr:ankyrin repeat and MYND domain-containing protein 2 [Galendromus occidentalis]
MSLNTLCQQKDPDLEEVKELLAGGDKGVLEELDSHGVTPLQQAAFRGNADLVRLLLKHGADVNTSNHSEGYTTLMFGALSGNLEVVRTLLDAGAKITPVNKVNRTAAEMAAFVGLKDVVSVIKGFVPRADIERFAKPQGVVEEARLAVDEIDPLRSLILELNIHPVKVVLRLRDTTLMNMKVASVLKSLSDTYFLTHCNEWLSGKLHILKCIVEHVSNTEPALVLKHWLKPRPADGFKLNLDDFMRSCVRSYPFHESSVFRQMVMTLAHTSQTAPVTDDGAVALCLGARDTGACNTCWETGAESRCSACKAVTYCNKECQKLDWPSHKRLCAALKEQKEAGDSN